MAYQPTEEQIRESVGFTGSCRALDQVFPDQWKTGSFMERVNTLAVGVSRSVVVDAADAATINPGADTVILGRHMMGSPGSYEQVGHRTGTTYFHLSDDVWNNLEDRVRADGITDDSGIQAEMWKIVQQFLDNQIAQDKQFIFVSDPMNAPAGAYARLEYEYLVAQSYRIVEVSGIWRMVR